MAKIVERQLKVCQTYLCFVLVSCNEFKETLVLVLSASYVCLSKYKESLNYKNEGRTG